MLLGAGEANGPPAAAKAKSRKQKTKTKRKARATLGHAPRRSDGERACASAYVEICAGGVELGRLECGEGFPEPLAMVDVSVAGDNATPGVEEFLYYLTDVQGSVGALTNAVGQVVERYFYTPYGQTQITAADGTTPRTASLYGNPFAYTGQRYEPQTGLYHFRARAYSPTLGRFLQEDMQGVVAVLSVTLSSPGSPPSISTPGLAVGGEYGDSLNLYMYALANPMHWTDPLGLSVWDEWVDDFIAGTTADRIAAAHHAFERLGNMAQAVAIAAIKVGISVVIPGAGLYFAAEDMAYAIEDMYHNGVNWNNSLALGLSTAAGVGSAMAAIDDVAAFAGRAQRAVTATKAARAAPSQGCRLFPEKALLTNGKHGVSWTEAFARAKKMNKPQGKWGSKADIDYAVNVAKSQRIPPGSEASIPLPPGHACTVAYPNGCVLRADYVWIKIHKNGKIHGYPKRYGD